jgi:D-xylose 1-dehydrogenase (NADP+, D-xylono-1,5-lactone-forming)
MRTLRWGLLGTARITRSIIPALRAAAGHELAAVASRSAEKAEAHAKQWQIPRAIASYEAMLADPDIDVVYIPLPNHLHAEWTIRAAEAGKHVLCEKPIALTVDEVDRIAAAATRAGVVVSEAFMYRHHPQTMMLKQLVGEGAIGELRYIRGSFTFTLNRPGDVRFDLTYGGGSLWDVGCYPVSLARVLAGMQPREVFGHAQNGPTGIDEMFAGQLIFTDKLQAQFDCGFAAPFRTEAELVGTTGSIRVTRPFKPGASETLVLSRGDDFEQIAIDNAGELYVGEVEDMGKAILEGTPSRVTLADSRDNTAVLVALYESARLGKPVTL